MVQVLIGDICNHALDSSWVTSTFEGDVSDLDLDSPVG